MLNSFAAVPLAALLLLAAATHRTHAQNAARHDPPLSVREAATVRGFADRMPVDLSPDGAHVAFTVSGVRGESRERAGDASRHYSSSGVPRAALGANVMVVDTRSGAMRDITGGVGSSWNGVWSPDGNRLAFYWDSGGTSALWTWDRRSGALRRSNGAIARPYFGFETPRWSPDGRLLLVKLLPTDLDLTSAARLLPQRIVPPELAAASVPDRGVTATVYATRAALSEAVQNRVTVDSAPSFFNAALADLALVDASTGEVRRIVHRARVMGYRFSPDGNRIAYSTREPDAGSGSIVWDAYHLHVVDLGGQPLARTTTPPRMEYGLNFSWSPDGTRLAWADRGRLNVASAHDLAGARSLESARAFNHEYRSPLWYDRDELTFVESDTAWIVPAGGGPPRVLHAGKARRLVDLIAADGIDVLPRMRNGAALLIVRDESTKRMAIHRVSGTVATSIMEGDVLLPTRELQYRADVSADGRTVVVTVESARHPEEIWVVRDGRARQLTSLHGNIANRSFGGTRLVEWRTGDGRRMQGALLLPAGHEQGRRYPLVVRVYGGSRLSNQLNVFGLEGGVDNLHLLATRGYAVMLADAPTRPGTPAADIAESVVAGVDAAIATGFIDPRRIALLGHSYGGYSVLAVASRSDRFSAVVSSGGMSNLFSHYTEMRPDGSSVSVGWSERGQGRMGASPWEATERYLENSPFFVLDRVTAPVLLLHGAADPTVRVARAEETFVALRRLGKDAVLVRYEGEGHHPGSWSMSNAEDYWQRIFDFLGQHLPATRDQHE